MNKKLVMIMLFALGASFVGTARENSTRKNLKLDRNAEIEVIDTIRTANALAFDEKAIVMRGYAKQTGASKETFMLTNNTNLHISQVKIAFKYTDINGELLHERSELVDCDLPPYSTRQASVKSWDEGNRFYYYKSKSRKEAIAYNVKIKVIRYDIVVSEE